MNLISDYDAHKRDEEFDRDDQKHRAPVTHAQRVAFADAMMAEPVCEACDGTGRVSIEDSGNITEASCNECSREKS
jgi:hypothetical protein